MEETSGFTNFSYGRNTRFLNQAINKLRECGSEAILGEMPKIAVIGNQSAGKSSLIEAMSGIRVPRQVGTCTRCPMEVVLSHSDGDAWSCQISLRIMYDAKGILLSEPHVIPFGEILHNSEEVEKRLFRAQAAVLQLPLMEEFSVHEFLQDDYEAPAKHPVDFSRNVVRLEVCGPDLVNVTFIDLPGIISNANQKWVETVNKLVSDYISQPDCLILVAISMSDDIENQGAAQLARFYDNAGKRTIGVLTKADTVRNPQVFKRWYSIIMGEDIDHRLAHGYYLTMQERPEPDSTWIQNLKNESDFFQTSRFWTKLDESAKKCIGTLELRKKLSLELSRLIKTRIPALISEVTRCAREISEQYCTLPRPVIDAPNIYLYKLCGDFFVSLTESIKGDNDQKDLVLMIYEADRRFLTSVKSSIAQFGLADHDEKQKGILTRSANEFLMEQRVSVSSRRIARHCTPSPPDDSDGDVIDVTPSPTPRYTKIPKSTPRTPSKPKARQEPPPTPPEDFPLPIQYTGEYIELEELRKMIGREKARKVAETLPFALQERLIRRSMALWKRRAMEYSEDVSEGVQRTLKKLCTQYFSRFERSGLLGEVWELVNKVLKDLSTSTTQAVTEQFEIESRPFTQKRRLLQLTTKQLLKSITEYRRSESQNSINTLTFPNQYQDELYLIAQVLGYVDVAYNRVVDNIPMLVEAKFQCQLVPIIEQELLEKLLTGEGYEKRCQVYLEDAPELIAKRQDLMKKLEVLRMAGEEVNKFQTLE